MAALHVHAFLKGIDELKTKKEKLDALRSNRNPTVDKLLQLTFDERIEFELPETAPPYKPSEFDEYRNLHQEIRKVERTFVKGTLPDWPKHKREANFINLLEYVDKDDALLLVSMLAGKTPFKTVDKKLVKEALPELFA